MSSLRLQAGLTLIELIIVMAIGTVVMVPLGRIAVTQLVTPARIAERVVSSERIQAISVSLAQDAWAAGSFTPGVEPDYGIFEWSEFSGEEPVQASAQYSFRDGAVFRVQRVGTQSSPPELVIGSVASYDHALFRHTPSGWAFDEAVNDWVYTNGHVEVAIDVTREAGAKLSEFQFMTLTVVSFRPQQSRPVDFPDLSGP